MGCSFFSSCGFDCHDFSKIMESVQQLHLPISSGPWDTFAHFLWTYVGSGSSGGLKPKWERLGLPSPCFEAQEPERCGKSDHEWKLPSLLLVATRFPDLIIWEWVGGYVFLILPFLTNLLIEAVLQEPEGSPNSVTNSKLQMCLTFPDPFPKHATNTPISFPGLISLLYFSSTRRS